MISFSERAWAAYEEAEMSRYYFDLGLMRRYAARNQTPTTPNVAALYGLHTSLQAMMDEGVEAIAARHERIGTFCRQRALEVGLGLYAEPGHRSNTVTAVTLKEGMDTAEVLEELRTRYDIMCGASKDPDVDMIRIGHMGYVTEEELDEVFDALEEIMGD
jgi:aspartate aminotransferase-like enzyme